MPRTEPPRNVVFLVYPEAKLLDLTGPLQVFSDAVQGPEEHPAYRTVVVSRDGGFVESDAGLPIASETAAPWARRQIDTFIVVGGGGAQAASRDARVCNIVTSLARRATRVASVCTGAFLLGACKLLKGRRTVTHWEHCHELATAFPEAKVEMDPIYIKDGKIWTSAGVTAGIDLALAMVAEDLGRKPALDLARSLVAYVVRPGGQSQFSAALHRQTSDGSDRFGPLHQWLLENLDQDLRIESLAARAHMSPRNFSRLYAAQTGQTPAKAIEGMRLEAARRMLEESDRPVARIAELCGFGDDERMRRSFVRTLRIPPQDYRRRFRGSKEMR